LNAGNIVRAAAEAMGGSGGGRPNLAQAGGKLPDKLNEAMDKIVPIIQQTLK
jgi:alanyl-tRNA synthetase